MLVGYLTELCLYIATSNYEGVLHFCWQNMLASIFVVFSIFTNVFASDVTKVSKKFLTTFLHKKVKVAGLKQDFKIVALKWFLEANNIIVLLSFTHLSLSLFLSPYIFSLLTHIP